ncbi:hypothetical protein [Labrenzia sp. 011]|uniref:hypothetical protein n=1 Tax=Labrenzia sp. 011 TaxID=2171494 RepID=UPI000D50E034|nr:hypothetical protein [Labrenzia sp. 011]PVB60509.1 hypothetical protein DCO57_17085 [Labrenzia sp. 011]
MLLPLPRTTDLRVTGGLAWNDPKRALYPHEAVLWPAEVPEHVLFKRRSQLLVRRWRRRQLKRILWFHWFPARFRGEQAAVTTSCPDAARNTSC